MKFRIGRLVATKSVSELMSANKEFANFVSDCLHKYVEGDWGDMCAGDLTAPNSPFQNGDYWIQGSYPNLDHEAWKIWIVTEPTISVTTVLFPSEY